MRKFFLGFLCLSLLVGAVPAQSDGDIVVGQFRDPKTPNSYGPGSIFYVVPGTGKVDTIASVFTTMPKAMGPNCIKMASNNKDFVTACIPTGTTPTSLGSGLWCYQVDITGAIVKTLVADSTAPGYPNALALDYDGTWVIGGGTNMFLYNENTNTLKTVSLSAPSGTVNALTIDHDLPKGDYCICKFATNSSTTANLIEVDRSGFISTISTGGPFYGAGVEVDRMTGDYLCAGFGISAYNASGGEFTRVTKAGAVTTINYPTSTTRMFRANGIYIDQMHCAWILTYDLTGVTVPVPSASQPGLKCSVFKMDSAGVYITQYIYGSTLTRANFAPAGLCEYGGGHVVCDGSGKPGTSVMVDFTTRRPSEGKLAYQLACSFGYKGGIKMASGEYLDLTWDALMWTSVFGGVPSIFQNFAGFLDVNGEAKAQINIPGGLPTGLGFPIYVSGIVLDPKAPGGVGSVGNTHWFVLN